MRARAIQFGLMLALSSIAFGDETTTPDIYFDDIPDINQINVNAGLPGDGAMYCAPAAVSNSLVWLESNNDEQYQLAVMKKLAGPDYMSTSPRSGTGVVGVLRGLKKYVTEVHGGYQRLEYAGWREVPDKYHYSQIPTLSWMLSGLHHRAAVWLNTGWYSDNGHGGYERNDGHWLTLVGYRDGKLIVQDPGPWAGNIANSQSVSFEVLTGGQLLGNFRGLPSPASGYLKLDQAMPAAHSGSIAIIDGAVLLELQRCSSQKTTISQ